MKKPASDDAGLGLVSDATVLIQSSRSLSSSPIAASSFSGVS